MLQSTEKQPRPKSVPTHLVESVYVEFYKKVSYHVNLANETAKIGILSTACIFSFIVFFVELTTATQSHCIVSYSSPFTKPISIMTILFAPAASSKNHRKRCRPTEENIDEQCPQRQLPNKKSPKQDFHLCRMEHRLEWASKCAREGNSRMMEYYLAEAEKDAWHVGGDDATSSFAQWKTWIQGQLVVGATQHKD